MMWQILAAPPPELGVGAMLLGLAIAIILHEVAHGYVAFRLGDPTAKLAGRLTLNPIKHVDLFGTIIVPGLLLLLPGGMVFGWAKPVPVNYYNLRRGKYGPVIVALAGPATNLVLVILFALLARLAPANTALPFLCGMIALVNGWLMVFNLLPIPPLDGSKVLYLFLEKRPDIIRLLEQYGLYIFFAVIFFAGFLINWAMYPVLVGLQILLGPEIFLQVVRGI